MQKERKKAGNSKGVNLFRGKRATLRCGETLYTSFLPFINFFFAAKKERGHTEKKNCYRSYREKVIHRYNSFLSA